MKDCKLAKIASAGSGRQISERRTAFPGRPDSDGLGRPSYEKRSLASVPNVGRPSQAVQTPTAWEGRPTKSGGKQGVSEWAGKKLRVPDALPEPVEKLLRCQLRTVSFSCT